MWNFGNYTFACRNIPSLGICNLFAKQLLSNGVSEAAIFGLATQSTAGIGVNPACSIPALNASNSLGNIADIVLCGLSFFVAIILAIKAARRPAAVARGEYRVFFGTYGLLCVFQLLSLGSFIEQGSGALVWITAVHIGLIVALFWQLLWLALLSLQVVEDGRPISYILLFLPSLILLVASTYIALDTGLLVTNFFKVSIDNLQSAWLFSLTALWPVIAIAAFYGISIFVSLVRLQEAKPIIWFTLTLAVFALAQGARYALSYKICTGTSRKVDGSFLGTLLETAAVTLLFYAWRAITEDNWLDYSEHEGSNAGFL